jgi:ADP-sugar diphosphatase
MIDSVSDGIQGTAIREVEEECGIQIVASELIDLTQFLITPSTNSNPWTNSNPFLANTAHGLAPSPGGCDEHIRLLYLHRFVTQEELAAMQGRLTGLRDEGELITLHVIPYEEAWKISGDMKVMWYDSLQVCKCVFMIQ